MGTGYIKIAEECSIRLVKIVVYLEQLHMGLADYMAEQFLRTMTMEFVDEKVADKSRNYPNLRIDPS